MYSLGINFGSHDSAAALVKDGEVIAAVEEERLKRIKHFGDFPEQAVRYCLDQASITAADLASVSFHMKPPYGIPQKLFYCLRQFPKSLKLLKPGHARKEGIAHAIKYIRLKQTLSKGLGYRGKVHYIPHYLAHAASTYFVSPFHKAAILTMDFIGEWESTAILKGEPNKLSTLLKINYPNSLGLLYGAFTQYLGFRWTFDEYKVMGLSSYGKPTFMEEFKKIIPINSDGIYNLNQDYFRCYLWEGALYSQKVISLFGPPRKKNENIMGQKRFADIACSLQKRLEEVITALCHYIKNKTGIDEICFAGGVAANSVASGKISHDPNFKDIFVTPAPHDAGCALGAALYTHHVLNKNEKKNNGLLFNPYLGPAYNQESILHDLKDFDLSYKVIENPARECAQKLNEGKVVGWYQGRLEWGQRALGNRSILADPRREEMKDVVNKKIKFREPFRPFAPSVLAENISDYFVGGIQSPYMLHVDTIKENMREKIPATTHVDGTGRLQSVFKHLNPLYWELINEFKKLSGIPVVLNTSFNVKDEPIICRPKEAVNCFLETDMDVLIMNNILLEK